MGIFLTYLLICIIAGLTTILGFVATCCIITIEEDDDDNDSKQRIMTGQSDDWEGVNRGGL